MSDSDFRPGSEEEWDALLRQWRLRPQATPQPFFYGRVRARLLAQAPEPKPWLPAWLRRPAYAAILAGLVLAVSSDGASPMNSRSPAPHPVQQRPW